MNMNENESLLENICAISAVIHQQDNLDEIQNNIEEGDLEFYAYIVQASKVLTEAEDNYRAYSEGADWYIAIDSYVKKIIEANVDPSDFMDMAIQSLNDSKK